MLEADSHRSDYVPSQAHRERIYAFPTLSGYPPEQILKDRTRARYNT